VNNSQLCQEKEHRPNAQVLIDFIEVDPIPWMLSPGQVLKELQSPSPGPSSSALSMGKI
jgi:hypothetical protein